MFRRIAIYTVLALITSMAHAENIYRAGSEGDAMYKRVEYLLPPEVSILLMPLNDRGRIINSSLDANAFARSGMSAKTLSYLTNRTGAKLTAANGIYAYSITGTDTPGNEQRQRFCGIVFTSVESESNDSIFMHEALHCKNAYVDGTDEYKKAISPAWKQSKGLSEGQFRAMLDEATVGGIQVAYAYNYGNTAGLPLMKKYAAHNSNYIRSIGFRTARGLFEMCGKKDACPTDTIGMINAIVQNSAMLNALLTDMTEIQAASNKAGLVLSEQ